MDCSSCHNPHTNAAKDLKIYSAKCIGCHAAVVHQFKNDAKDVEQLKDNCIDCHMPAQPSKAITFQLAGSAEKSAYLLRTHKIAVYFQPPPKER
jgi:hypothetical protein